MTIINLYRYEDERGVVITPTKRAETDEPYCYRLVADEGKILTDGATETYCVDTHNIILWSEIDDPNVETDEPIPAMEPEEPQND